MSYLGSRTGSSSGTTQEYPVANGVTVTIGDFVYLSGNSVTNASIAGKRLLGQVISGDTVNLDRTFGKTAVGNASGTVKVLVEVEPEALYLLNNDNVGTTFAASHVGQFFDLTGATGAQLVDTSTVSATVGALKCVKFNPGIRGTGATYGIFMIAANEVRAAEIGAS